MDSIDYVSVSRSDWGTAHYFGYITVSMVTTPSLVSCTEGVSSVSDVTLALLSHYTLVKCRNSCF